MAFLRKTFYVKDKGASSSLSTLPLLKKKNRVTEIFLVKQSKA